jgi:PPOX class probable F420-dependent enzyme
MAELTDPAIARFLSAGDPTGKLGYTKADGQVVIVPIWYLLDDGDVVFATARASAKTKAFARDPRVAFSVDETGFPPSWVHVEGRVVEDEASLERLQRPLVARYVPEDQVEPTIQWIRGTYGQESLYRIKPTKVRAQLA